MLRCTASACSSPPHPRRHVLRRSRGCGARRPAMPSLRRASACCATRLSCAHHRAWLEARRAHKTGERPPLQAWHSALAPASGAGLPLLSLPLASHAIPSSLAQAIHPHPLPSPAHPSPASHSQLWLVCATLWRPQRPRRSGLGATASRERETRSTASLAGTLASRGCAPPTLFAAFDLSFSRQATASPVPPHHPPTLRQWTFSRVPDAFARRHDFLRQAVRCSPGCSKYPSSSASPSH